MAGGGTVWLVLEGEAEEGPTHVTTLPHMSELNLRLRGRCVMSLYSHLSKRCHFTYLAGQPGKVAAPHLQGRPGVSTATSGEQCVLWQELGEGEVCWRDALHLETA